MNGRLVNIEDNFATRQDIDFVVTTIDGYAGKINGYAMEMAAMQHKIDRLERMINYLADKVSVKRSVLEGL